MAVPEGPTEKRYTGNGVTKIFTIPFLLLASTDLDVFLDGVEVSSGFVITGVGNPTSTITFAVAPADQSALLLNLNVPFERLNDYQENGDFLSSTVNRDFDRIWQALKQLLRWSARSLRLGDFDVDGSGWYRAKGNGISDLHDPVQPQDAATKQWSLTTIASIIGGISGNPNLASNVFYLGPDGLPHTVQELSTTGASLVYGAAKYLSSIAALRLEPGLYEGQRIMVDSYYPDNTGTGGGLFRWSAASTTTDDGGAYIKCTAIATGRWHRVFAENYVSAAMWGMRQGLSTNQIDPAKKAIAFAAANGKQVVALVPGDVYISLETVPAYFGAGLIIPTGIFLDLRGTKLRALATSSSGYSVILFKEDCLLGGVFGGEVIGERDTHIGTTGEFGMGINVRGAKNIFIKDTKASKCWGDGVYLGADTTGNVATYSENVVLENVTGDLNRRNGMSVVNARGVFGDNLLFSNTSGTAPQAGIDIEPDSGGTVQNVQFGRVRCFGNAGAGFLTFASIAGPDQLSALTIKGVSVDSLVCHNNAGPGAQISLASDVTLPSVRSFSNGAKGLILEVCLRPHIGMVNLLLNAVTGTFSRGDLTVTGCRGTKFGQVTISDATGPSAIIVRGCDSVKFGPTTVTKCTMGEAAIQIEVESTDICFPDVSIDGVSGYGIYADSSCSGVRLGGGRLRDIGKTNANAIGILNQSPGAAIHDFNLTNTGATKPLNGIVSTGDNCIVTNNRIPAAQTSSTPISVSGSGSISTPNLTT